MSDIENTSKMKIDPGCTLNTMLGENNDIEIPIIQRDYAQGRSNAKEIRDDFLKDLFDHFVNNEKIKLSFVYGTTRKTATKNIYIPYDGQQRITLIYLITLYMAARCSDWSEIAKLSRFKYYTRDYATEFCTFLTNFDDREESHNSIFKRIDFSKDKIMDQIKNDIAFFGAWEFDPTAVSMMVVLESIHMEFMSRFARCAVEEQKKNSQSILNALNDGIVFFDWCTINASDNIYIKMNGRGKPLSAFDNFKNTLYAELDKLRKLDEEEGRTDRVEFLKRFEVKMDGEWTDLFWNLRSELSGDTDDYNIAPFMMNFLFFVFELKHTEKTKTYYFSKTRQYFTWIDEKNAVSFLAFFKEKCKPTDSGFLAVTLDDYIWLSKLLDILNYRIGNNKVETTIKEIDGYPSEFYLLDEVSTAKRRKKTDTRYVLSAESSIVAAMYFEYLVNVSSFDLNGEFLACDDTYRAQWLQLIGRAMKTARLYKGRFDALQRDKHIFTSYNDYFVNTVIRESKVGNLIEAAPAFDDKILNDMKSGFDASHVYSQVYEEIFKYKLIADDPVKWESRIRGAEVSLPYFDNQIYFIFKLAEKSDGTIDENRFDAYLKMMQAITDAGGIKENLETRFSAILLSFEDYRVRSEEGHSNAEGLCSNDSTESFKWRHFFDLIADKADVKLSALKQTLDLIEIEGSVEAAYNAVVGKSTGERWRDIIIKYPNVLLEVDNRHRIVYKDDNNNWYLINSRRVAKQVHITSLEDSINLDLYGILQESGVADNSNGFKGKILNIFANNVRIEPLGNNQFKISDDGVESVYDYQGTIDYLKGIAP